MKKLIIILLFLKWLISYAQTNIPEDMFGTWELNLPGGGKIPSQIFKWIFYTNDLVDYIAESHWLFKRIEDKAKIPVYTKIN